MNPVIRVSHFTDPGCPWAFSAEPHRRALMWRYGGALAWHTRMVVLSETVEEYAEKGFDTVMQAASHAQIARAHGMPIDPSQRERMLATVHPCRAVVAVRRHDPVAADRLLRELRVAFMRDRVLIDEPDAIAAAAGRAGIDRARLARWIGEPETEAELRADMDAARRPAPGALALDHKLAGPQGRRRYTCPSYVFASAGREIAVPGFQPLASYEVAIANLAPGVAPRPPADDPSEVLRFFGEPLATAEVAAVMGVDRETAEDALATTARLHGGYWLPASVPLAA